MDRIKQPLTVAYKLSRIYQYYGSIIFISVLGASLYKSITTIELVNLLVANILMTIFFFSFNNVEDYKDDARDPAKIKHNPISAGKITMTKAKILSILTLFSSLYLYYLLGNVSFLIGIATGLICFLYSWKRVRLKSKPVLGLVSHGTFHTLVFINSTFLTKGSVNFTTISLLCALIFFTSALVDFESEIRDYEVDKKAKLNNTISKLNIKNSSKILVYISILSVLLFFGSLILLGNTLSSLVMIAFGIFIATHFLLVWKRDSKFVYYYPYSQQTLLAYGIIILLF
ncbi:UbiA family prenyltransferase [Patescibacteria group bacterium]